MTDQGWLAQYEAEAGEKKARKAARWAERHDEQEPAVDEQAVPEPDGPGLFERINLWLDQRDERRDEERAVRTRSDTEVRVQLWRDGPPTITHEYRGTSAVLRDQLSRDLAYFASIGYEPVQNTPVPGKRGGVGLLFAIATFGIGALLYRPRDSVFVTYRKSVHRPI